MCFGEVVDDEPGGVMDRTMIDSHTTNLLCTSVCWCVVTATVMQVVPYSDDTATFDILL